MKVLMGSLVLGLGLIAASTSVEAAAFDWRNLECESIGSGTAKKPPVRLKFANWYADESYEVEIQEQFTSQLLGTKEWRKVATDQWSAVSGEKNWHFATPDDGEFSLTLKKPKDGETIYAGNFSKYRKTYAAMTCQFSRALSK